MLNKSIYKIRSSRHQRTDRAKALAIAGRHPFAVPFITFAVLIFLTGAGIGIAKLLKAPEPISDAKIVIISHDNTKQVVPSRERTVGGLLQRINIKLDEGDVVEPAVNTAINQDDFRINIYRAVPVQIVDGTKISYTFSAAKTGRSIAAQAKTEVFAEDKVSAAPVQDFVRTGAIAEQVIINRSKSINLNLYGTPLALRTHAETVGELIKQNNITLAKDDQLLPSAETPLTTNAQVFVVRNGIKIETVNETIAMPVQNITDPTLAYGTKAVRQKGSAGKQVITYQNTLRNDQVVSRSVLQKVVTVQPVTEIVVVGTSLSGIKADMARAGIAPADYQYADFIIAHESGWRPFAHNASSGAYGLCQALPGTKMASAGADWETNPVTQLRWCTGYAQARYGGWSGAHAFWLNNKYW